MPELAVPVEGLAPRVKGTPIEEIHRLMDEVDRLDYDVVVRELNSVLGAKLVAAIGQVKTTRMVKAWIEHRCVPDREVDLAAALKATRAIALAEGPSAARRWFLGTNRFFDHRSPLEVIGLGTPETRTKVVRAALAFIAP